MGASASCFSGANRRGILQGDEDRLHLARGSRIIEYLEQFDEQQSGRGHSRRKRGDIRKSSITDLLDSKEALQDFWLFLEQIEGSHPVSDTTRSQEIIAEQDNATMKIGQIAKEYDVANLPTYCFRASSHECSNSECGVCIESYEDGDAVTKLPCGHVYHIDCIQSWLNEHCTCPSCRYELTNDVASPSNSVTTEVTTSYRSRLLARNARRRHQENMSRVHARRASATPENGVLPLMCLNY
jgi:hypothetical protein